MKNVKLQKIDFGYKIDDGDDLLDWVRRNWWDLPHSYLVEDSDGVTFNFRRVDYSEMEELGFGDIYCAAVHFALLPAGSDVGSSGCTFFDDDGNVIDDLESEIILSEQRLPDTISNRAFASRAAKKAEIYVEDAVMENEDDYIGCVLSGMEDEEDVARTKAEFHEMVSGGKLMPDWGRTTVHGVTFLIQYIG